MAKIIYSDIWSRSISNYYPAWQFFIIGITLGVLNWGLATIIGNINGSENIAGNIAAILTATVGIVTMVRLKIFRPLIIASATAISLWGLTSVTNKLFWIEAIGWNILIYTISYMLFSWLCRFKSIVPVLFSIIIIIILVHVSINL